MNLLRRERVITLSYFGRIGEFIASFGGFSIVMTLNLLVIAGKFPDANRITTILLSSLHNIPHILLFCFAIRHQDLWSQVGVAEKQQKCVWIRRFCIVFNAFVCFTLYNATFAGNNLVTSVDAHKE